MGGGSDEVYIDSTLQGSVLSLKKLIDIMNRQVASHGLRLGTIDDELLQIKNNITKLSNPNPIIKIKSKPPHKPDSSEEEVAF
jgi:hypothetical protein